jgi:NADPH:quinone reductase
MKAKAIRIHQFGGPEVLQLDEVEVGDPGPDEVRIRNHAVGLNYIDVYYRTGLYPTPLPAGLGFEAAGVVEAVGSNVKFLKEGDRVAHGQGPLGAYADVRVMPATMVVRLPKKISFDEAAAVMLKGLTVQYLFRQTYRLQGNETILFHAAAGGVGLIACQWAKALGVKLIGTVSSDEKAALAKAHGAWATINYSRENFAERVKELTGGAKVPVVYDGVGKDTWEGLARLPAAARPDGELRQCLGRRHRRQPGHACGQGIAVRHPAHAGYARGAAQPPGSSAEELFDLMLAGTIKVDIDQRYTLADAAQAHRDLQARKTTGSSLLLP